MLMILKQIPNKYLTCHHLSLSPQSDYFAWWLNYAPDTLFCTAQPYHHMHTSISILQHLLYILSSLTTHPFVPYFSNSASLHRANSDGRGCGWLVDMKAGSAPCLQDLATMHPHGAVSLGRFGCEVMEIADEVITTGGLAFGGA